MPLPAPTPSCESIFKLLSAISLLFTATPLMAAAADLIRHEGISVEAPFVMPPINVPVFPNRDFLITQFGAREGGDISEAIRKAIAACHDAGIRIRPSENMNLRLIPLLSALLFTGALSAAGAEPLDQFVGTKYDAVADGQTLNTQAIQRAIDAAEAAGGGTIVIPKGVFLTGAIFLKPGVNLRLEEGAVLKGSERYQGLPEDEDAHRGAFRRVAPGSY